MSEKVVEAGYYFHLVEVTQKVALFVYPWILVALNELVVQSKAIDTVYAKLHTQIEKVHYFEFHKILKSKRFKTSER